VPARTSHHLWSGSSRGLGLLLPSRAGQARGCLSRPLHTHKWYEPAFSLLLTFFVVGALCNPGLRSFSRVKDVSLVANMRGRGRDLPGYTPITRGLSLCPAPLLRCYAPRREKKYTLTGVFSPNSADYGCSPNFSEHFLYRVLVSSGKPCDRSMQDSLVRYFCETHQRTLQMCKACT
jgi:hypothetical protein